MWNRKTCWPSRFRRASQKNPSTKVNSQQHTWSTTRQAGTQCQNLGGKLHPTSMLVHKWTRTSDPIPVLRILRHVRRGWWPQETPTLCREAVHLTTIQNWKRTNAIRPVGHLPLPQMHQNPIGGQRSTPTSGQTAWHIEGQRWCFGHELKLRIGCICGIYSYTIWWTYFASSTQPSISRSLGYKRRPGSHPSRPTGTTHFIHYPYYVKPTSWTCSSPYTWTRTSSSACTSREPTIPSSQLGDLDLAQSLLARFFILWTPPTFYSWGRPTQRSTPWGAGSGHRYSHDTSHRSPITMVSATSMWTTTDPVAILDFWSNNVSPDLGIAGHFFLEKSIVDIHADGYLFLAYWYQFDFRHGWG